MSNIARYESGALALTHEAKPEWGKANDRRGVKRTQLAVEFVKDYPIGTVLSAEALDIWLQDHGMLTVPPKDAPKNSDAWLGHLQRRHIIRNQINKAATHPRLLEKGSTPFSIDALAGGFEVRAPHQAISKSEVPRKVQSLVGTKKRQLAYLMQSTDFPVLPEAIRETAEEIFDAIQNYAEDIRTGANRLDKQFTKLQRKIQLKLEAGSIVPTNGGIKQLLASPSEESEAENVPDCEE